MTEVGLELATVQMPPVRSSSARSCGVTRCWPFSLPSLRASWQWSPVLARISGPRVRQVWSHSQADCAGFRLRNGRQCAS